MRLDAVATPTLRLARGAAKMTPLEACMRPLGLAAAVVLGLPGGGAAEERSWTALLSFVPRWAETPSAEEVAAVYPSGAQGGGVVNLTCAVLGDGRLSSCRVQQAAPALRGFEQAALALAPRFKVDSRDLPPEDLPARPLISLTVKVALPGETRFPCLPPSCVAHH